MRDVGYDRARKYRHLFPHAVVHGTDGSIQAKHPRFLLAEERDRDGHPELDVPLVLAHLRVRPVLLRDDPERRVEHLLCLRELLLRKRRALEARRKHRQRVRLGREATFIRMCRALDFDRVNRREPDRRFIVRQDEDTGPCEQGAARNQLSARPTSARDK